MKNILYVTLAILVAFIIFEAKSLFFSQKILNIMTPSS